MNTPPRATSALSVAEVYDDPLRHAVVTVTGVVDRGAVSGLEQRLTRLLEHGARSILIDLFRVPRCDCRLLAALVRVRDQLHPSHGRLHIRGLADGALCGFDQAGVMAVWGAYRAAATLTQPQPPLSPDPPPPVRRCDEAERRLARVGVELADCLAPDVTEDGLAARLITHCLDHLGADAATVVLADQHTRLRVAAASHSTTAQTLQLSATVMGHGPGADTFATGEPVCVSAADQGEPAHWPLLTTPTGEQRVTAIYAVPLRYRDLTIGVLNLFTTSPEPLPTTDLDIAQAWAQLVTITILAVRRQDGDPDPTPPVTQLPTVAPTRTPTDATVNEQDPGVLAELEHRTLTLDAGRGSAASELRAGTVSSTVNGL